MIPSEFLKLTKRPLVLVILVTKNGRRMNGADREVTLRLCNNLFKENARLKKVWCTRATFYEAGIQMNAIVSHPWLADEKIAGFPPFGRVGLVALGRGRPHHPSQ